MLYENGDGDEPILHVRKHISKLYIRSDMIKCVFEYMQRDRKVFPKTVYLRISNIIVSRTLGILKKAVRTYLIHLALAADRIRYTLSTVLIFYVTVSLLST